MGNITQISPLFKVFGLSLIGGLTGLALAAMPSMASTIKDIDF